MSLLDIDLNNVPDEVPVPAAKPYRFRIDKVGEVKPQKEDTSKNTLHQQLILVSDDEFNGTELMDYIGVNSTPGQVRLKKLVKCLKLDIGQQVNVNHFVGRTGWLMISHQIDSSSGRQIKRARVADYLLPGEAGTPKE
jgi:hypothetical protein